jgi:hypothetical protein
MGGGDRRSSGLLHSSLVPSGVRLGLESTLCRKGLPNPTKAVPRARFVTLLQGAARSDTRRRLISSDQFYPSCATSGYWRKDA